MNNKVDKLFKEKLGDHTLSPSPQAWEKVEAQLSKKNKTVILIRVAAVLALFAMLTFVLLKERGTGSEESFTAQTAGPEKTESPAVIVEEATSVKKEKTDEPVKRVPQPIKKSPVITKSPALAETKVEDVILVAEVLPETVPHMEPIEKRRVLVYSLPPVARKNKNTGGDIETAVREEKKSTIERVMAIAKDVKNSDNPIGDLREAKDDLFAFDFKKDKNKKQ